MKNKINTTRNHSADRGSHAIVIGGSMAGLLAARVLVDHFDRVTIVERDHLPDEPQPRSGTPQARHFHQLLERGRQIMEQLFPGLLNDLLSSGAPLVDLAQDLIWLTPAGWTDRYESGLDVLACSRDLLEWSARRRLLAQGRVEVLQETETTGLLADNGGTSVSGVIVRPRHSHGDASVPRIIRADLVVDASGRNSKASRWLQALGYEPPGETLVDAHLGYASRFYHIPSAFQDNGKAVYIQAAPPDFPRAGIMVPVEGNRWLVSANGAGDDTPPTSEAGFLNFLRHLRHPLIYETLKEAEPASSVAGFGNTGNRLRHFDQLARWPERFIVLGDAVCSFNPVYGQGMTVAALESMALDEALRRQRQRRPDEDLSGFARRFQKEVAKIVAGPFTLATSEDYRYAGTEGGVPGGLTRFMHWYLDQITRLRIHDRQVNGVFLEVLHMLKPPPALFHPRVAAKVIRQLINNRRSEASPTMVTEPRRSVI